MICRFLFSSAIAISSSGAMRAASDLQPFFLLRPCAASACSRAVISAISRFCFSLGLDLLPLQFEDRFAGLDVLLLDRLFFLAVNVVGQHVLAWPSGR